MKLICSNFRKIQGGYLASLMWPYGDMPCGMGSCGGSTFLRVLGDLISASEGHESYSLRGKAKERLKEWEGASGPLYVGPEQQASSFPRGTELLRSLSSVKGGFVAVFPKDPEKEVFFSTFSEFLDVLVSFEYALPPDPKESK